MACVAAFQMKLQMNLSSTDSVIPVPTHTTRLRGYHGCAESANAPEIKQSGLCFVKKQKSTVAGGSNTSRLQTEHTYGTVNVSAPGHQTYT